MKLLFSSAAAAVLALTAVARGEDSAAAETSTAALLERLQYLEKALHEQREHFNSKLDVLLARADVNSKEQVRSSYRKSRRRLGTGFDDFAGIEVRKSNAGVVLGEDADVGLFRTGDAELTLDATVQVDGELFIDGVEESIQDTIGNTTIALVELQSSIRSNEILAKASSWFPAGSSSFGTYVKQTAFGDGDSDVVFDYPYYAQPGYGRMVDGVFTAPVDGVYYITAEIRIADDDTTSTEVEFMSNGVDTESFEMWAPAGDSSGRRTCVSAMLAKLCAGDTLYPISDIAPSSMKSQTDVFQIGSDRISFSSSGSTSSVTTGDPLMASFAETVTFFNPPEYSDSYSGGIFTAPRAGYYYFLCKMRTKDADDGDMEIEFQKNGGDTDASFEMWMHTGDGYERRAQMSAAMEWLDEGDTFYPITDLTFSTSTRAVFSAFELPDDLPLFKAVSTTSFGYPTKYVALGVSDTVMDVEYERGSDGAFSEGVYTVPRDGFYSFTMKLRTLDKVEDDVGIEYKVNGEDAAHNMVMWMHQGDSNGRRSGISTTMLKLKAGDEVMGVSNLALSSSNKIGKFTFSGFMLA